MTGENDLKRLLKDMRPVHNTGEYVFCTVDNLTAGYIDHAVLIFKEREGNTLIIQKELADSYGLEYSFVASWITLTINSSLESVGLTAAFSKALSDREVSCNVVAAYYHDHIFVNQNDTQKAMEILSELSI